MKKQYISPAIDIETAWELAQMVCTSTKTNVGDGQFDNEGNDDTGGGVPTPDDPGLIDSESKENGFSGWNAWE